MTACTATVPWEVRTLATVDELLESYRLRYEVYDSLGYIQHANRARLEIDAYDAWAIPFGAFDPIVGVMIGTLRLITGSVQPEYQDALASILAALGDDALAQHVLAPHTMPLPSMVSNDIVDKITAFNCDRFIVQELSRTVVRPSHRGTGVSRALMELGLAYAAREQPSILIGGCLPQHVPMYAKYGYVRLPDSGFDRYHSVGQMAISVICRTDVLPEPTRGRVALLLRSLSSGDSEQVLDLGDNSRAIFRFLPPALALRQTMEFSA